MTRGSDTDVSLCLPPLALGPPTLHLGAAPRRPAAAAQCALTLHSGAGSRQREAAEGGGRHCTEVARSVHGAGTEITRVWSPQSTASTKGGTACITGSAARVPCLHRLHHRQRCRRSSPRFPMQKVSLSLSYTCLSDSPPWRPGKAPKLLIQGFTICLGNLLLPMRALPFNRAFFCRCRGSRGIHVSTSPASLKHRNRDCGTQGPAAVHRPANRRKVVIGHTEREPRGTRKLHGCGGIRSTRGLS